MLPLRHLERTVEKSVGTALVITTDNRLIDHLFRAFKEIDVAVVRTGLVRDSLELIHGRKFEAFVVDTALDNAHLDLLSEVRSSSSNHTAVVVAIAPSGLICEKARKAGANFVLEQPLTYDTIHRTLGAAYGMIVREYRRYFRAPLKTAVTVWSSVTGEIRGETVDLSEEGMAIRIPYCLGVGTELLIRFKLSDQNKDLVARANIIHTSEGGISGLHFVEISSLAKGQLHEWLSHRLEEKIPSLAKHSA